MVRFSRFRSRSASRAKARPVNQETRSDSNIKQLINRQSQLSTEDAELQAIVNSINSAHAGREEAPDLKAPVLMKQRTSSSSKSSTLHVEPKNKGKQEPLWKRRLRRAKTDARRSNPKAEPVVEETQKQESNFPNSAILGDEPSPSEMLNVTTSTQQSDHFLSNDPPQQREPQEPQLLQEPEPHASERLLEVNISTNEQRNSGDLDDDKPTFVTCNSQEELNAPSEPAVPDDTSNASFSLATPSVYTETTNPVSMAESSLDSTPDKPSRQHRFRMKDKNRKSGLARRHRHQRYTINEEEEEGDDVSSLGKDDDTFEEDARCSVSSIASDALTSAAVMILQCNEGIANSMMEDAEEPE